MKTYAFPALVFAFLIGGICGATAIGAEDPPPITKKDHEVAVNKLKQFGLACQNYHDTLGELQGNIVDKDGKPLLSWRVAILPFIEQQALYDQFKRDEPWDSDHNKKLIEKMPMLYAPVRVKAPAGETFYQMFEGEHTLIDPKRKKPFTLQIISSLNGASNTGMIFEAGNPVIWTKPVDLKLVKDKPLPKLGGMFDGAFHVVFCDGHVQFFKKNPDEEVMRCIIDPANLKPYDTSKIDQDPPGKP